MKSNPALARYKELIRRRLAIIEESQPVKNRNLSRLISNPRQQIKFCKVDAQFLLSFNDVYSFTTSSAWPKNESMKFLPLQLLICRSVEPMTETVLENK
jgi:hypothetical protein